MIAPVVASKARLPWSTADKRKLKELKQLGRTPTQMIAMKVLPARYSRNAIQKQLARMRLARGKRVDAARAAKRFDLTLCR